MLEQNRRHVNALPAEFSMHLALARGVK